MILEEHQEYNMKNILKRDFFNTFSYIRILGFDGRTTVLTLNVSEWTMLAKVDVHLVNQ